MGTRSRHKGRSAHTLRWITFRTLFCLCVTGCSELSQRIAAQEAEERDTQDDQTCRSYGTTPGTAPYLQCRELLSVQRVATAARQRAIAAQTSQQMMLSGEPHSPVAR